MTKRSKERSASELPSFAEPVLLRHLRDCKRVLIAGAGGGFDVYAGLPLAHALWSRGQEVHLANSSFTNLAVTRAKQCAPNVFEVNAATKGSDDYFPERSLAQFLEREKCALRVFAFARCGVPELRAAYEWLVEELSLDAIVLVDGGTDILMCGDEEGLGTPIEDMSSLAAVGQLRIAHRHVACLGFGVDAFHGVSHGLVLENIAALERDGAFHGAFSVPRSTAEGDFYLRAVEHAQRLHEERLSIVNGSIASALQGNFGDTHFTDRTRGTQLFINPLMGLYFTFDLMGVCKRNLYLRELVDAPTPAHVGLIVDGFSRSLSKRRKRVQIPH